jgi:hypothetical protein
MHGSLTHGSPKLLETACLAEVLLAFWQLLELLETSCFASSS